jgi:hypothetical protein
MVKRKAKHLAPGEQFYVRENLHTVISVRVLDFIADMKLAKVVTDLNKGGWLLDTHREFVIVGKPQCPFGGQDG